MPAASKDRFRSYIKRGQFFDQLLDRVGLRNLQKQMGSQVPFYILIMDEKVLVLCERWLSKFSSNLYVLRPPESEKMVFTKVSVCL